MTIKESLTKHLTELQLSQALANVARQRDIKDLDDEYIESSALASAFIWHDSVEGHYYWSEIDQQVFMSLELKDNE
jgi:urease gamma subunit